MRRPRLARRVSKACASGDHSITPLSFLPIQVSRSTCLPMGRGCFSICDTMRFRSFARLSSSWSSGANSSCIDAGRPTKANNCHPKVNPQLEMSASHVFGNSNFCTHCGRFWAAKRSWAISRDNHGRHGLYVIVVVGPMEPSKILPKTSMVTLSFSACLCKSSWVACSLRETATAK